MTVNRSKLPWFTTQRKCMSIMGSGSAWSQQMGKWVEYGDCADKILSVQNRRVIFNLIGRCVRQTGADSATAYQKCRVRG